MATSVSAGPRQPDIAYTPDIDKHYARAARRIAAGSLPSTLPVGFPEELKSDLVWDSSDIASRFDWTFLLSEPEIEELSAALQHFKASGRPLGHIDQDTFPLPTLHPKLREISHEIHHGFGFKVIRGLPVENHPTQDILIMYTGLASHIASVRGRQDSQYEGKPADVVLNHIKDLSGTHESSRIGAPAYTADKQVFHTDSGDVIALLCLEEAAGGGQSKLSSAWRVYNDLATTRPDLIQTLAEEWPTEIFGDAHKRHVNRALLHYAPATSSSQERIIIQYARRTFTGFQGLPRSTEIPPITEAQAEALDALHFLAEKYALGLDFRKGDVQFVNNLSIFHARDGFTNSTEKQRHLVRLWLRDPVNAWEIPRALKGRWDKVFKDVDRETQVFPLEPYIRSASLGKVG